MAVVDEDTPTGVGKLRARRTCAALNVAPAGAARSAQWRTSGLSPRTETAPPNSFAPLPRFKTNLMLPVLIYSASARARSPIPWCVHSRQDAASEAERRAKGRGDVRPGARGRSRGGGGCGVARLRRGRANGVRRGKLPRASAVWAVYAALHGTALAGVTRHISWDAIYLKRRGFKARWMTWRAIYVRSYPSHFTQETRVQNASDDGASSICQALLDGPVHAAVRAHVLPGVRHAAARGQGLTPHGTNRPCFEQVPCTRRPQEGGRPRIRISSLSAQLQRL
jgi:hypothetical protein